MCCVCFREIVCVAEAPPRCGKSQQVDHTCHHVYNLNRVFIHSNHFKGNSVSSTFRLITTFCIWDYKMSSCHILKTNKQLKLRPSTAP